MNTKLELQFSSFLKESDKINTLIDKSGLIMFFTKDEQVFATDEEGRISFAEIKQTRAEDYFSAFNLSKAVIGEKQETVFGKKDIKKITIITKEEAIKILKKSSNEDKILQDLGETKC